MNIKNVLKEKMLAIFLISLSTISIIIALVITALGDSFSEEIKHINKEISDEDDFDATFTYPANDARNLKFKNLGDGKCSVSGIGKFEGTHLEIPTKNPYGATVVSIEPSAFENCSYIKYIFIPSTIQSIGEKAFKGCLSLCEIRVDGKNESFCSNKGILYSKNKATLMCYPPNKSAEEFLINEDVKIISNYAFDGLISLRKILYEGTPSDFQKIRVGIGNARFSMLPITCNYN